MQFMTFRRWSSKGLTRDFCLLLTPRLLFGGWDDVFDVSSQQGDLVKPRVLWLWMTRPSNRRVSRKPTGRWNKLEKKDCRMGLNLSEAEQKWEESFWVLCAAANCVRLWNFLIQLLFLADNTHHMCSNIGSHPADSPAHRRCWHLLRDPRRRQGAQSLPEGQGAAGDQAPQSHGEGEYVFCPALKKPFRVVLMLISLPFAIPSNFKR